MAGIPGKCPHCGEKKQWKEVINPLTTGIPIGNYVRVRSVSISGLFSRPIKKALGFYRVQYRCHKCGFKAEYELPQ